MEFEPRDKAFTKGYWYHQPEENFPPSEVFHLDPSFSKSRLCLAGTPESSQLSDYKIKQIMKGWADILPKLTSVKILWVAPKVNQPLFEAICSMPNLRGLWLKHTSIEDITPLNISDIQYLSLGSSPKVKSLKPLTGHKQLAWLETENLKHINDFSPLSSLENLVGLGIHGSTWTTQKVATLKPLSKLIKLRFLALINTKVLDKSLEPLHQLNNLETVQMAKWWPQNEVDLLIKSLPRLKIL